MSAGTPNGPARSMRSRRGQPLTSAVRDALIDHRGAGRLLDCLSSIEAGDFDRAEHILPNCSKHYLDAVAWSNDSAGQRLLV